MERLLEGLNNEQKLAVQALEGPVLINAGAGSGKTRVLTTRIAALLENGILPSRILALTFTKKAAGEMKKRIATMTDKDTKKLVMGTFHSVFIKFLRSYSSELGYPEKFTIYDEDDSLSCIKACIKEAVWGPNWQEDIAAADKEDMRFKIEKRYKPKGVLSMISLCKNDMLTCGMYCQSQELLDEDRKNGRPLFGQIYMMYVNRCFAAGAMDFDDILLNTDILLATNPDAYNDFTRRFDYILVDEYQDTNKVQYSILKRLTALNKNICVVGDDSQSIYGFRGAKIDNILNFHCDYPDYREFRLETNYRSTSQIVNSANRLIENNEHRLPKECISGLGSGATGIRFKALHSDEQEAQYVVDRIMDASSHGVSFDNFAILYRTNQQSRCFENELINRGIPYTIYSGISFFQRAEIKDLMAYFKLAVNPKDDEAFRRVVNRPKRGFGSTSLITMMELAWEEGISLYEAARNENILSQLNLRQKAADGLKSFVDLIDSFGWDTVVEDASTVVRSIVEKSGILEHYAKDSAGDKDEENKAKACTKNIQGLIELADKFVASQREEGSDDILLNDFLDNIALLSNVDATEDGDDIPRVCLMTCHCSKGLEFPYVFVTGAEETIFPLYREEIAPDDLEEERRLFYVAITRAKKILFVTWSTSRFINGTRNDMIPSRFIAEMQ